MSPEVDDLIQLNPYHPENTLFPGAVMVVNEVRDWGVISYMLGPKNGGVTSSYWFRAKNGTFAVVGKAKWVADKMEQVEVMPDDPN